MQLLILSLFLGLCFAPPSPGTWNATTCTFTYQSKTYDLSALRTPTGYHWKQLVYQQDSANLLSTEAPNTLTFNFEINVCANVVSQYPSCKVPSPANMISSDGTNCTSLGDLRAMTMDLTPFQDGVLLAYFHGTFVDDIHSFATFLYITCGSLSVPSAEHLKIGDSTWHIMMTAPQVC